MSRHTHKCKEHIVKISRLPAPRRGGVWVIKWSVWHQEGGEMLVIKPP